MPWEHGAAHTGCLSAASQALRTYNQANSYEGFGSGVIGAIDMKVALDERG